MESLFFWIFAAGTVFFGAQVVLRRNPVYAAISLVGAFFFLAGIYVLLSAHLIAILQVIVYAGAVMVLFVFVIMLLNLKEEELGRERITAWKIVGGLCVLVAVGLISWLALSRAYPSSGPALDCATNAVCVGGLAARDGTAVVFGSVKSVGKALYLASVLPFEITSLLLTVAIVGAVVVAKGKI